jgi:hypothetical protein
MRLDPAPIPLRNLIKQFNTGEIALPPWQRPYVWRIRQTLNLLDSLHRGFPVGVIYLWRPNADSPLRIKPKTFRNREGHVHLNTVQSFVIDGQQRLTSLEAAFGLSEASDERNGRSVECWLELATADEGDGKLTRLFSSPANTQRMENTERQDDFRRIPLQDVFSGDSYQILKEREDALRQTEGWDSTRVLQAVERLKHAFKMLDQPVTCITVSDASDEEVLQIFKRLNKGGTGLREGDVKAADLGVGTPIPVLEAMRKFVNEPAAQHLGFGFSFAFRALVVFHKDTARFKTLARDWAIKPGWNEQSLAESWRDAERGLRAAMDFVASRLGWSRRSLLPSANALIPLAVAFDKGESRVSDDEAQEYIRWLCLTALREVWQGGVETTIGDFLRELRSSKGRPSRALLAGLTKEQKRPIQVEEFDRQVSIWGPFTQVMYAWLVQSKARDWMGEKKLFIDLAKDGDAARTGDLTVQHIFPRQMLAENGFNAAAANWPGNFAILARSTNSALQHMPPADVLKTRLDSDGRKQARTQFFDSDVAYLLRPEKYEEFCTWRAEQLATAYNEWLGLDD